MKDQMNLFESAVPITSEAFTSRLASVLAARTGSTHQTVHDLAKKAVDGAICPCCGSKVQVYPRQINKGQVKTLQDLCRRFGKSDRFKSNQINARGGDYAKLVAFGLLKKFDDGTWSITQHGFDFAAGLRSVSRYAFFFFGEHVGLSAEASKVVDQAGGFSLDSIKPFGVEMVFMK